MKKPYVKCMFDLDLDISSVLRGLDIAFRELPVNDPYQIDDHLTKAFISTIGSTIIDTLLSDTNLDDPTTLDILSEDVSTLVYEMLDDHTIGPAYQDDDPLGMELEECITAIYTAVVLLLEAFHKRYNYTTPPWLDYVRSLPVSTDYNVEFLAGYRVIAIIGEDTWG